MFSYKLCMYSKTQYIKFLSMEALKKVLILFTYVVIHVWWNVLSGFIRLSTKKVQLRGQKLQAFLQAMKQKKVEYLGLVLWCHNNNVNYCQKAFWKKKKACLVVKSWFGNVKERSGLLPPKFILDLATSMLYKYVELTVHAWRRSVFIIRHIMPPTIRCLCKKL